VGDSGISFFRALAEAEVNSIELPVLSYTTSENELAQLGNVNIAGHYVARTSFPATPGTSGDTFAARFRARYGEDSPVSEQMESSYYGVLLWAEAVRRAGTDETGRVRSALLERDFDLKGVHLRVDPSTQHTYKIFQLARITSRNTLEVFKTDDKPIKPNPFPPPRTNTDWKNWTDELYHHYGNNWSNPKLPQLRKSK
jgi:urea transport system substrate-binding protein